MKLIANIEAEQVVLGTLLSDPKAAHFAGLLTVEDFTDVAHKMLFRAIDEIVAQGRAPSPIIVGPQFVNDKVGELSFAHYLARLVTVRQRREVMPDYIRALKDMSGRRTLAEMAVFMADTAKSASAPLQEFAEHAVARLDEILSGLRHQRITSMMLGEIAERRITSLRAGEKPNLIDTGLPSLNKMLGGFSRGNLIVLAGRPSMGKTTFAVSAMRQAAKRGVAGLMFSQEMPSDPVADRLLSDAVFNSQTPIQYERISTGEVKPWEIDRLEEASKGLSDLPIRIDEQSALTVSEMSVRARRYADQLANEGKRLDVIWIDHLGFIQASSRYSGNKVYEISDITKSLRTLAKELDVAIVLLCQLNRQVQMRESKRPQLSDLRDSGAIEEDADIVLFAYREHYYLSRMDPEEKQEDEMKRLAKMEMMEHIMEIICDKRRNGSIFTRRFFADMASNTVRDLA